MRAVLGTFLTLLLLATCCCLIPPKEPTKKPYEPAAILVLHGDVDFRPEQRAWVELATRRLAQQSNGFIQVSVIWDLDFTDEANLARHKTDDTLIAVMSLTPTVMAFDITQCGGAPCLLGLTSPSQDDRLRGTSVYLVVDRLNEANFSAVTMHELLHALGMPHTHDPMGLMYPNAAFDAQCMHESDIRGFCDRWGCNPDRMFPCND